jgi:hypothetical protein
LAEDYVIDLVLTDRLLDEWECVIVREQHRTPAAAKKIADLIRTGFPESVVPEHGLSAVPGRTRRSGPGRPAPHRRRHPRPSRHRAYLGPRRVPRKLSQVCRLPARSAQDVVAIGETWERHDVMIGAFEPVGFAGDLFFFTALSRRPEGMPDVSVWVPLVAGRIIDHHLDVTQAGLMDPQPAAEIARAVAEYLDGRA